MKRLCLLSMTMLILWTSAGTLKAQELYITNEWQKQLQLLDLSSGQLTALYDIGASPDDLVLNSLGQLLYSIPGLGVVDLYDPVAQTNSTLVTGVKSARDLVIEPSGNSMLIAVSGFSGEIVRFNFLTGATSVLRKKLVTVDGLAYDPNGDLFAVADHNTIQQIDPVTGATLNTLVLEPHHGVNGGDGMTYDPYTGELWASHDGTTGSGVLEIATDLSSFTYYDFSEQMHAPDGIKSDGLGNLYIGAIHTVAVINIQGTPVLTRSYVVHGADGVSLVPGTYQPCAEGCGPESRLGGKLPNSITHYVAPKRQ